MASGKKGKKNKGKTLALTDFLQETPGLLPTQPIRKTSNWADEVEENDGFEARRPLNVILPTAPKASRDFDDISDQVPKNPPFIAYLSNLPYDVDDEEIADFFRDLRISSMRIPKDDRTGETPRLKGYGYVEFEDRDSLMEALCIPDTTLKNRRIRIEVATNVENDRRRGRMDMGKDRDRSEASSDWRSGPRDLPADDRRGGGGGFSRDRDNTRDREFTREGMRDRDSTRDREFTREGMRESGFRDRNSGFSRDRDSGFSRDRDSGFSRDREGGFGRDREGGFGRDREGGFGRDRDGFRNRDRDDGGGSWREADRSNRDMDRDRGFSRGDRGRFDDRDRDRDRGFSRRYGDREDKNDAPARDTDTSNEPKQRPKLQLAPRSKPIEASEPAPAPVPSASIFGNAKPVDTAQREREIEEKLRKEQEQRLERDGGRDMRDRNRDNSTDRGRSRRPNSKNDNRSRDRRDYDRSPDGNRNRRNDDRSTDRDGNRRDNSLESDKSIERERNDSDRSIDRNNRGGKGEDRRDDTSTERRDDSYDRSRGRNRDDESPERKRVSSPREKSRDTGRKTPVSGKKEQKSPETKQKNDRPKREEKKEKEMAKLVEPEPPNFTASNKFAFLQTDDNSD